jgi:hypothetical protein
LKSTRRKGSPGSHAKIAKLGAPFIHFFISVLYIPFVFCIKMKKKCAGSTIHIRDQDLKPVVTFRNELLSGITGTGSDNRKALEFTIGQKDRCCNACQNFPGAREK